MDMKGFKFVAAEDGTTIAMDEMGPIAVYAPDGIRFTVTMGEDGKPTLVIGDDGMPVPMMDGDNMVIVDVVSATFLNLDGTPEVEEEDMMQTIMSYLATAESVLWPEGEVTSKFMKLLSSDMAIHSAALTDVKDKLDAINGLLDEGEGTLREKSETAVETGVDFVGGILSAALGKIGDNDNFPQEIDESTGLIRIVGEVGKFLQNFDTFAAKMTGQTVEDRNNKMVRHFVANLDSLMENVLALADIRFADEEA